VWNDSLWTACERSTSWYADTEIPQIGCDVARYGDDWTVIVVRCGPVVLGIEEHNGWGTDQTAGRLKELAKEWAAWATERISPNPHGKVVRFDQIPIKVDDDGVGGGVVDQLRGHNVVYVGAGTKANDPESYPNRRSELWFATQAYAREGFLNLSKLPSAARLELKRQAMAVKWKLDGLGRRCVSPKDEIKKEIGRSPDGMDALNLAFYSKGSTTPVVVHRPESPPSRLQLPVPVARDWASARGLFGMGGGFR
jgi:hypothetical protein